MSLPETSLANVTPERADSFETVLAALEAEVARLEKGELPLEEALAAFERGLSLSRRGESMLAQAERKVEQLLDLRSGKPTIAPFEPGA
jgi:exodeoxyribonuclease VII small subunit